MEDPNLDDFLQEPKDINEQIQCQISEENNLDHTVLEDHQQKSHQYDLDDYQINTNLVANDY